MNEYRQDLFWANIPVNNKIIWTNLGFLEYYLKNCSLFVDRPFMVYTGTNRINRLEKLKLNNKTVNRIRKRGLDIYLYEPLCYRIKEHNRSFYSEFKDDVDLSLLTVDEFDSIKLFLEKYQLPSVNVFCCDYQIQKLQNNYPTLNLNCHDIFLKTVKCINLKSITNTIEKKFWCGNWRYTAHRHIVAAYLSNKDASLSWMLNCNLDNLKSVEWVDNSITDRIPDKIPYSTFDVEAEATTIEDINSVYIPNHSAPGATNELFESYKKCFCAVVNETRYAQPFGNISEKVLYPINAEIPFILVAPPRSLEYIKKLGFKTFNELPDFQK